MNAGQLNKQITIQRKAETKNTMGGVVISYVDWVTVWAAIEPAVGNQYYAAKQLDSTVSGKIRIRYLTGLLPTMRIKYGNRYLSIVSIIQPKEDRREIVIMYSEELD